ncbi:hypothetical protein ESB00_05530 [Oleiharenicola lentus]|uniref:Uncharacterized protein n=1 Tax=Oleiharenicola lentus TaxID=2508720 RepID=A0A4V1M6G9_9BACT|nr:DUF6624 domain-containing protein [Oleiharenicola lentus]RXK55359.1 hypothetical protein ESB00_05530 [Oleiharenicola lentus]
MRVILVLLLLATGAAAEQSPADRTVGRPEFAAVRTELLAIVESDQKYREAYNELARIHPVPDAEMRTLTRNMQEADAANLPKLEAILAQHGWLGPDDVGPDASGAFFLVIQHSNLPTQKKYLPAMREAVKAGKARGSSLALLEDRIELHEGRPQIYGSQLRSDGGGALYVQAMIDPDHVDERRAAVGLPPMADYLKRWDLTWDLAAYKARLPDLIAKLSTAVRRPPKPQSP